MAELIPPPGGERAGSEAERRVVDLLVRDLPDDYAVIPDVMVAWPGGQQIEYPAIVVAPHAVYVIDVRDWQGRITGDRHEWLVDGGRRTSPMVATQHKANVLMSRLVDTAKALATVRVEPVVALTSETATLELSEDGDRMVVRASELVALITDPATIGQQAGAIAHLTSLTCRTILNRTTGRSSTLRFREYEVLETLDQTEGQTFYLAHRVDMPAAPEMRLRVVSLPPHLNEQERSVLRDRLYRDAETLWRMGAHPNVLTARDAFQEDERIVVVLDRNDSVSLRQRLAARTPLTVEERLGILADICRGLTHAHINGVIHRLVTPTHVVLDDNGQARLTDFGLARLEGLGTDSTVWRYDAVAEPDRPYIAPELLNPGLGSAGPGTDLYGLGRIAWELFGGDEPSRFSEPLAPLPGMPSELAELVGSLLQTHPAARQDSTREVLGVLESIRGAEATRSTTGPKQVYEVGDLINDEFEVRGVLGSGGAGHVYRVYRALDDTEFALKLFNNGGFRHVQREIRILRGLQHRHIEEVVWATQTRRGQWYLVKKLVDGEALTAYAKGAKRLSIEDTLWIADQLLDALEYMHPNWRRITELRAAADERSLTPEEADELYQLRESGIIHRDVKPQNLLLTRDGVMLIDFNIASPAGQADTFSNTPQYCPPDMALGPWSPSYDLFSTGVTLYELICCEHPYEDRVPSYANRPIDPREFRPNLSAELAELLLKACAPLATDRFASAAEMREALAAIEAPLVAAAPRPVAALPSRLEALLKAAPPNENPMVAEFLAMNSQARQSNRETRGLTEVALSTYVETRLDKELTDAVRAGSHRLIIITGNAGDGKTAFIQRTEERAIETGAVLEARDSHGTVLRYGTRLIRTLYDGSEDKADQTSDEMLRDFLAPFAVGGADDGAIRLGAINEGRLRDFITSERHRFPVLVDLLGELEEPGSHPPGDLVLVNLNLRATTAGGPDSIFSQQLRKIVDGPFWEPCQRCAYRTRCPIKHNVDTLADPVSGPAVIERLRRLADLVRLRRRHHFTMRDVRSLQSHILFRDRDCREIAEVLAAGDPMAVADLAYFQAPGGLGVPDGSTLERGAGLLREVDVALVANPALDRSLAATRPPARMSFPRRESDYPFELITAELQAAGTGYEADAGRVQRAHAALRRLLYFERRDQEAGEMLPYRQISVMDRALAPGGEDKRAALRTLCINALSVMQDLANVPPGPPALWLAVGNGGSEVRGFRRFPADEFEVRVADLNLPYVEAEPDRLDLVHLPSSIRLPIDLDVLELLERLREGYIPSADESRGMLIHIKLFLNQLRALSGDELVLMTPSGLRRIVARPGGVVELTDLTELAGETS